MKNDNASGRNVKTNIAKPKPKVITVHEAIAQIVAESERRLQREQSPPKKRKKTRRN